MASTARRGVVRWGVVIVVLGLAPAVVLTIAVLPRDDVPREPDAVIVLGGAGVERAALGLALSRQHDAVLVLSSSAAYYGVRELGLECGVDAMCVDPDPENTQGEARLAHDLAAEHGWDHVTVATSRFHTSRARILFRQCLGDRVSVVGAPGSGHRTTPLTLAREALGIVAAWTVQRAC